MRDMRFTVPNLTPDLGGAASLLYEMGGMVIFHDAAGCCENYAAFDEPRLMKRATMVYSSSLLQMDAVLGNDEPLIAGACEAASRLKPRFVAILGTPVPAVIGMDLDGIAAEIEARAGTAAFAVHTGGFEPYTVGADRALCALIDRFAQETRGEKSGVNLLGATPLDFDDGLIERMKRTLESANLRVNAVLCMGASLEDVENASNAAYNIAVSRAGLSAARRLYERFGTPFDAFAPLTETQALRRGLSGNVGAGERALVVGEEIMARSLSDALNEKGYCASFLSDGAAEDDIARAAEGAEIVIADPLIRPLVSRSATFIECPHRALSAHLFEDRAPAQVIENLLGE